MKARLAAAALVSLGAQVTVQVPGWVTGRKPKGKGWALDPGYKGDTVLQASTLRLVKPPADTADTAQP